MRRRGHKGVGWLPSQLQSTMALVVGTVLHSAWVDFLLQPGKVSIVWIMVEYKHERTIRAQAGANWNHLQPCDQLLTGHFKDPHGFRCAYAWRHPSAVALCLLDGDQTKQDSHGPSPALWSSSPGHHFLLRFSGNPIPVVLWYPKQAGRRNGLLCDDWIWHHGLRWAVPVDVLSRCFMVLTSQYWMPIIGTSWNIKNENVLVRNPMAGSWMVDIIIFGCCWGSADFFQVWRAFRLQRRTCMACTCSTWPSRFVWFSLPASIA